MKTIVIAEMFYHAGHKTLNQKYIQLLSQHYKVIILDNGEYFNCMDLPENVRILQTKQRDICNPKYDKIKKYFPFGKSDLVDLVLIWLNLISIRLKLIGIVFDKVIFLSTRLDSLAFALPFYPKGKVASFHHSDVDDLCTRKYYRFFFNLSKNHYDHIFLSEFLSDGLRKIVSVDSLRIHHVYQPLVDNQSVSNVNVNCRNKTLIGLGQTCDMSYLNAIVEYDKVHPKKLLHQILIRDKELVYKGNNIEVFNRYLSREEFNSYLNNSAACVLLYPSSFNLRYSGILDDALSHGMSVYGTDIPAMRHMAELYPKSCHVIKDVKELFEIADTDDINADRDEIEQFLISRSEENIIMQFHAIMKAK